MMLSFLLPALAASASALGSLPLPKLCITEPPLLLVAGESTVQATNHNPTRWDCRAVIHFSNPAFAPIIYPYSARSCHSGSENTSFLVPPGVPNRDAFVTWACGIYTQACVRAVISNRRGDPELPAWVDGAVDCQSFEDCDEDAQPPSRQTSNSTDTPTTVLTPAITERSTYSGGAADGDGASSWPPTTPFETIADPTVTTNPAGSSLSESQTDSTTSVSTEGSAADEGFTQISNATRVTTPTIARSLLTVTRTVTTLITTTLTARR